MFSPTIYTHRVYTPASASASSYNVASTWSSHSWPSGVLKAGGAYFVLRDGATVTQFTLEYVLHDSASKLLALTMNEYLLRISDCAALCLEDLTQLSQSTSKPQDLDTPTNGIYNIYTSGACFIYDTGPVWCSGVTGWPHHIGPGKPACVPSSRVL